MGLDGAILRMIDANLNRAGEGLRVIEEVTRLTLSNASLSSELKTLRHGLVQTGPDFQRELIRARDAFGDVGRDTKVEGEEETRDLHEVVVANSRRVQESLRVLEELAKVSGFESVVDSERFKQARFRLYAIEQDVLFLIMRQDKVRLVCGLYVIVDGEWLNGRSYADVVRQAVEGGARVIQLREKRMPKKGLLPLARQLKQICAEYNALFLVNDYLDVALDCDADGLHVGQEDLPAATARTLLKPDQILGCSASSPDEALAAQVAGADYVAVGSVFATSTKEIDVVGISRVAEIKRAVKVPVVAIGGVKADNVASVMKAGADGVAVITAVLGAQDPVAATRDLIRAIGGGK